MGTMRFRVDELRLPNDLVDGRLLEDPPEEGSKPGSFHLPAFGEAFRGEGTRLPDLVIDMTNQLQERSLLVREVNVEGALCDAGASRDLGHRRPFVTEFGDGCLGSLQNRPPRGPSPLGHRKVWNPKS